MPAAWDPALSLPLASGRDHRLLLLLPPHRPLLLRLLLWFLLSLLAPLPVNTGPPPCSVYIYSRTSVTGTPKAQPPPWTSHSCIQLPTPSLSFKTELLVHPRVATPLIRHPPATPFLWVLGPEPRTVLDFSRALLPHLRAKVGSTFQARPLLPRFQLGQAILLSPWMITDASRISLVPCSPPHTAARGRAARLEGPCPRFCVASLLKSPPPRGPARPSFQPRLLFPLT